MAEIPDEITLALNISNCPHRCKNCSEPWLREDIGTELSKNTIVELMTLHDGVSCICFMGGDGQHENVVESAKMIHVLYPDVKIAMYSGDDIMDEILKPVLDYYKIGHWDENLGPLDYETTNQKLFAKDFDGTWNDITYRFHKTNKKKKL